MLEGTLVGNVFVDDVGFFFAIGFSVHEIRALYRNGLDGFIRSMSVDPKAKIAMTWAGIEGHK